MSDPKLISPLLDGFMMGAPISSHDGVCCCPAMKTDSDERYIVKVISVPASQEKVDALLLAGAFAGRDGALGYFEELAGEITDEASLLAHLGKLEGFTGYDDWQIVPKEDGETGFDVYLVGPYRKTLARFLRRSPMTHLAAVNLGLDLCAALAVCRRNGYLYVDLKPENICVTPGREYKIADLGFVKTSSLSYASLPDKYLSAYTAPEIRDAFSSLNDTLDTYAVGLVLYQVYNNGALPFADRAGDQPLPPPAYADYEMAQIILKACDPDPGKRWEDPMQMGQALVSYLQRNNINDDPIVPPPAHIEPEQVEITEEEPYSEDDDPSTQQVIDAVDEVLAAVGVSAEPVDEEAVPAEEAAPEVSPGESSEDPPEETPEESPAGDPAEDAGEAPAEETASENGDSEDDAPIVGEIYEEVSLDDLDDTDEITRILAQADELIAHETPDPVVAPEPIDVPIPAPIAVAQPPLEEAEEDPLEDDSHPAEEPDSRVEEDEEDDFTRPTREKKSHKGLIVTLGILLLIAALGFGSMYYYNQYYLQPVLGITVTGEEDRMTVTLKTPIQEGLLTVVCTDSYGNTVRREVVDNKASFTDLRPNTRYNVTVEISGFHKLIGTTTGSYATPGQTSIHGITAVTGKDDGEVILNFTVQGTDSAEWTVRCTADNGEAERSVTFKGHMATVSGLTVGATYTFTLEPVSPLYLIGENTLRFHVTGILSARNLAIQGFRDNALSVTWDAPAEGTVESWTVRCYNDADYDKTITVTDTSAVFEDADPALGYTVEVTAAGMSVGARTFVSADSVTIQDVKTDLTNPGSLKVTWTYEGKAPEGGWLVLYTMDDDTTQHVVSSGSASAAISPAIPGTTYHISVRPTGGNTVFGGSAQCQTEAAAPFSGYLLDASNIILQMCRTPSADNWLMSDVPASDFVTSFTPGERASFAVTLNHEYNTSSDMIVTLFVIRDANGNVVSTATQSRTWTSMWYRGFGRINIPSLPETPGEYTLELYFNSKSVSTQRFSVVAA